VLAALALLAAASCSAIVDVGDLVRDDAGWVDADSSADGDADVGPDADADDGGVFDTDTEVDGDTGGDNDDAVADVEADGDAEPDACASSPSPPLPLTPENGAKTGSSHAPASFEVHRPLFRWRWTDGGCPAPTFDIQVDDSCAAPGLASCSFASPEAAAVGVVDLSWRPPSPLAVASTSPVGRRYYWRVRACRDTACSAWSPVRYVDVGRVPADFNGDGYSDIAVGSQANTAFVWLGGPAPGGAANFALAGESPGDGFGFVGWAGDVDADGFADLIVGAPNAGRAYVYLGGTSPDETADVILNRTGPDPGFGVVDSAGDVNADGFADVVVGSVGGSGSPGRAEVFFGGTSPDAVPDVTLAGEVADDYFGGGVSTAGDVNGDGFADIVVSAHGSDAAGGDAGRVYVYLGGTPPDTTADIILTGEAASDSLRGGTGVGDVNGDGFADLGVGEPGHDTAAGEVGRAFVLFGSPTPEGTPDLAADGDFCPTGSTLFGDVLAEGGDLNGDGIGDWLVGTGGCGGRVDVYFGGTSPDFVSDLPIVGVDLEDPVGDNIAGAGDVNGDGFADILVGAPSGTAGKAHVFFGATTPDSVPDVTFTGAAGDSWFGSRVARGR
jgi:hypothetical protein